jgi:hypothetical protein
MFGRVLVGTALQLSIPHRLVRDSTASVGSASRPGRYVRAIIARIVLNFAGYILALADCHFRFVVAVIEDGLLAQLAVYSRADESWALRPE